MSDQPRVDALSPRSLFAKASRFSGANVLAAAIGVPVSLFVARRLGPETLGRVQYVVLAYAYAAFVRLGAFEAGQRELVHEVARGHGDRARRAQNVGFTVDLIVTVLPGLALLAASWSFGDPVRRIGFALAPVAVVGSSVASFLANLHLAHRRFGLAANAALLRQVGGQLLVVAGVVVFGPYGLVLAPLVADWAVIGLYRLAGPRLGLALDFGRAEARRLVRAGFPLGAMALVYWSYRLAGNTAAALWTSVSAFGLYAFAAAPVSLALRALSGVSTVLAPTLWGELGRRGTGDVAVQARRLVLLLAVLAGAVTNFAQAAFGPAVVAAAPGFTPAIVVFEILAFDIVLYVVPMVPSLVLDSLVVEKQWRHLWLWAGALAVNLAANRAVTYLGYGIVAIAWNDVAVQALVVFALLYMTRNHLRSGARTMLPVAAILAWTAGVWLVLRAAPAPVAGDAVATVAGAGAWRVAIVAAAWAPVAMVAWALRKRGRRFAIRSAWPEDVRAVWEIANDTGVRANAFSPEPIAYDDHVAWYAAKLADPRCRIWVAEEAGRVVGLVRYDRVTDNAAEIDIAVAVHARGRGFGATLLRETAPRAGRDLRVALVRGVVFTGNAASASAFARAGFTLARRAVIRGRDCDIFERAT